MPATVVVGGQYGSEGKGKVAALLAARVDSPWLVRCGGPNSGHTVTINGADVVLRQVPCSTTPQFGTFCLAAGCIIEESILLRELDLLGLENHRIIVDPRAVLLEDSDRVSEQRELAEIASTFSGTGAALIRRISRRRDVRLAADSAALKSRCRVEPVAPSLHDALDRGEHVIVEGTQGFGLSLLHGDTYPFVTSRDTTAAGFASEVGLSPRHIDRIVVVTRTFPIRVGGSSGPFNDEISWEEVRAVSNAPQVFPEFTSVTKRLRRVAKFDLDLVIRACSYNRPTSLAVMGVDRLDYANTGLRNAGELTESARSFLSDLQVATGVPIEFCGTGFGTHDVAIMQPAMARTYDHV